jgi:hypothetical protein
MNPGLFELKKLNNNSRLNRRKKERIQGNNKIRFSCGFYQDLEFKDLLIFLKKHLWPSIGYHDLYTLCHYGPRH